MTYDIKKAERTYGLIYAMPSKSVAHRYLIAAAFADGESVIHNVPHSEDIEATAACLRALGARVLWDGDTVTVVGTRQIGCASAAPLPCHECGTTLRLLLPMCLLGGAEATLTGTEKLLSRPLAAYETLCHERGFLWERTTTAVRVAGRLTAGRYELPGNVSSQYISGLLYALTCVEGESEIVLTTHVESRSYIDLTIAALTRFGGQVTWMGDRALRVIGTPLTAQELTVEGDWSNISTWFAMLTMGAGFVLEGAPIHSIQGDRVIVQYLEQLQRGTPTLSVADCPDLAPTLMASAALLHGATLTDTARLRMKESDRGTAMQEELAKCGVRVEIEENRIIVHGGTIHAPSVPLTGHNDHRIVMACALLLTYLGGRLAGCEAVKKSYPDFFRDLAGIGVEMTEVTDV